MLLVGCYLFLALGILLFALFGGWGWVCLGALPGAAYWFYHYILHVEEVVDQLR